MGSVPAPPALEVLRLTFGAARALQAVALVAVVGLASNFMSETVAAGYEAPAALVGTLVVACLAAIYIAISYVLYWDSLLPLLVSAAADGLCLVAVVVAACVVGRPVSYLSCPALPDAGNTANFITSLFRNLSRRVLYQWVDADKAACLEFKAVWGLSICLCVLYLVLAVASACLWRRVKADARPAPKDVE